MVWDGKEKRSFEINVQEREIKLANAAREASRTVSEAAEIAIRNIANAATAAQNLVNLDIKYIKEDLAQIKLMLDNKYITKDQFSPVKGISYGLVSLALISVVGALLSMVLVKH